MINALASCLVDLYSCNFRAAFAASASLFAIAVSTFFTQVLTLDLIALFLAAFVSFTKILFFADLMLANLSTSDIVYFDLYRLPVR